MDAVGVKRQGRGIRSNRSFSIAQQVQISDNNGYAIAWRTALKLYGQHEKESYGRNINLSNELTSLFKWCQFCFEINTTALSI